MLFAKTHGGHLRHQQRVTPPSLSNFPPPGPSARWPSACTGSPSSKSAPLTLAAPQSLRKRNITRTMMMAASPKPSSTTPTSSPMLTRLSAPPTSHAAPSSSLPSVPAFRTLRPECPSLPVRSSLRFLSVSTLLSPIVCSATLPLIPPAMLSVMTHKTA